MTSIQRRDLTPSHVLLQRVSPDSSATRICDPSIPFPQNETSIAQDPLHPNHILASYNDYRRGDGACSSTYSLNSGQSWTDSTVPMGFTNGANFGGVAHQYWQTDGDTSVAWDTKGNAYLNCQVFMHGPGTTNNPDLSSAMYIFRSTGNAGASWDFPSHPVEGKPSARRCWPPSSYISNKKRDVTDLFKSGAHLAQ